jgi:hypothetical protein
MAGWNEVAAMHLGLYQAEDVGDAYEDRLTGTGQHYSAWIVGGSIIGEGN